MEEKMKIGIDIDDTIVITVKSMIKYADKYDTEVLGRKGTNGNLGLIQNRYYFILMEKEITQNYQKKNR